MKAKLLFVVSAIAMASCSTPKYSYKFDYHDYNAGRKDKEVKKEVASNPGPVEIQPEMLVAEAPVTEPAIANESIASVAAPAGKSAPLTLTKTERKEMLKEFKQTAKKVIKMRKASDVVETIQSNKVMDHDLKMALIFLVVALAASLLYGVSPELTYVVWLIAIIVSIVFFIKWLVKQ